MAEMKGKDAVLPLADASKISFSNKREYAKDCIERWISESFLHQSEI